ncbi:MAG: type II secretion system F family protein [Roseiflexaceae bacterium]|nr:type II secretion system F family protein [Roseiflexaceae bacterium]
MPANILPFAGAGVIFVVILGVFMLIARRVGSTAPAVDDRLSQFASRREDKPTKEKDAKALAQIDAVVSKGKRGSQMARDLARADVKLTVTEFIGVKILAAVVGGALGAVIGRASTEAMVLAALVGALLFSFVPNMYIGNAAKARVKKFNDQLGDTISMMANALRSGSSFLQTLDIVSREAPNPTSSEFRRIVQEVSLGLTTEDALQNLLKRLPSDDLDLLVTAVGIQMESGGNLAQILDTIGHTIRERVRIKGEIDVLTAQGKISAYVITGLPIALAIFITILNPGYMAPIFTFGFPPDAWCCLPVASLVMIVIGYFTIMKIIQIDV